MQVYRRKWRSAVISLFLFVCLFQVASRIIYASFCQNSEVSRVLISYIFLHTLIACTAQKNFELTQNRVENIDLSCLIEYRSFLSYTLRVYSSKHFFCLREISKIKINL